MLQIENEYTGDDFHASIKAINPSLMEGGLTGIMVADYMQSITPQLSLGLEGLWQRPSLGARPETSLSYAARYKSYDWIASAQIHATGTLDASYWRRLSDKVEAGVNTQLQFAPGMGGAGMFGGMRKEGQTSVGVKYSFATSVYRAQIDSTGKVGCVLEKRVAPAISFNFAAEIDQWKVSTARIPTIPKTEADSDRTRTNSVSVSPSRAVPKSLNNKCRARLKTIACRRHTRNHHTLNSSRLPLRTCVTA